MPSPELTAAEILLGDLLKDNDPRHDGERVYRVIEILPNGVRAAAHIGTGRPFTVIRRDRIFTDDKVRRSGWRRIGNVTNV